MTTSEQDVSRAKRLLHVIEAAESRARHLNGERIINCPNQREGEDALTRWRQLYPYVDPQQAQVDAVVALLKEEESEENPDVSFEVQVVAWQGQGGPVWRASHLGGDAFTSRRMAVEFGEDFSPERFRVVKKIPVYEEKP
jgi:hypothetical protein